MADSFLGEIKIFAGNFAPRDWAFCNGQLLSISQYSALFSLIGTAYGGNGTTTFAVPSLQGMAVVHQGQGIGLSSYVMGDTGGSAAVAVQNSEMALHAHTFTNPNVSFSLPALSTTPTTNLPGPTAAYAPARDSRGAAVNAYIPAVNAFNKVSLPSVDLSNAQTDISGNSSGHNNMQPFLVLNYIISLAGTFPARN